VAVRAVPDVESVAVMVTDAADWTAVGVPDTTPVAASMLSPAGSVPDVTAYVTGAVRPVGVNAVVDVIAAFTDEDTVCVEGEMDSARTVKVMVAVAVPVPEPVAVMVTAAADCAAVGVPDTTPVDALSDRPAGSVPDVTA